MAVTALSIDMMLPAFGEIRSTFGMDPDSSETAAIVTAFMVGLSIAQIFYGPLADRFGRKPILYAGFVLYALGAIWAADRVYMQRISPPRYLGEFYGLYATVGRFATVLGPLLWGVIVTVAGLPREVALLALIGFLAAARLVLQGVDDRPREWQPSDVAR